MLLYRSKLLVFLFLAFSSSSSRGSVSAFLNKACGQLLSGSSAALVAPWGEPGRAIDLAMQGLLFTSGVGNRRLLYRAMRSRLEYQSVLGVDWQRSIWGDQEAVLSAIDTANPLAAFISAQASGGVTVAWRPLPIGIGGMYSPSAKTIYLSSTELAWLIPEFMALHEADHAFLHKMLLQGDHSGTLFGIFVYGVEGNFDLANSNEMWTYPRSFWTILSDPGFPDFLKRHYLKGTLDGFARRELSRLWTRATALRDGVAEGTVEWKVVSGQLGQEAESPSCLSVPIYGARPLNVLIASRTSPNQRESISAEIPTRLPVTDGPEARAEGIRKLEASVSNLQKMQELVLKLKKASGLTGEAWVGAAKAVAKEMIELSDTMLFDETDPLRGSP